GPAAESARKAAPPTEAKAELKAAMEAVPAAETSSAAPASASAAAIGTPPAIGAPPAQTNQGIPPRRGRHSIGNTGAQGQRNGATTLDLVELKDMSIQALNQTAKD